MGTFGQRFLNAGTEGAAVFLSAGALLAVGLYGFAATFKPYESDRGLQPLGLSPLSLSVALPEKHFEPPTSVLPEVAAVEAWAPPSPPGEVLVSVPAAPPQRAPAAPRPASAGVSAAGVGGAEPAPLPEIPLPEPPRVPTREDLQASRTIVRTVISAAGR